MSKIFHAGSDVACQPVRFADLEQAGGMGDGLFVPLWPAAGASGKSEANAGDAIQAEKPGGDQGSAMPETARELSESEEVKKPEPAVDLEAVKKEAYTRGKKEGRAEAEKNLHTSAQALAEALEQISRLRESMLLKSREDMVRLIMGVARQVIHREISEKKDIIVSTVAGALEAAVADDEYYIRVHPDDLEMVKDHEPLFLAAMKGLRNIYFISDENISPGGCKAESRGGDVDATIESQLGEIEQHLKRAIV